MQPALLLLFVLPPPAARARVLAGLHRTSARRAADRHEAARMQRIHGNVVGGDIGGEVLGGPVGHWVDLDQGARLVPGGERNLGPSVGMLAPEAADPSLRTF